MINLKDRTIQIRDKVYPIIKFDVWFRTPVGLTADLELAVRRCEECDFDPIMTIVAVPVAVGPDSIYEELTR